MYHPWAWVWHVPQCEQKIWAKPYPFHTATWQVTANIRDVLRTWYLANACRRWPTPHCNCFKCVPTIQRAFLRLQPSRKSTLDSPSCNSTRNILMAFLLCVCSAVLIHWDLRWNSEILKWVSRCANKIVSHYNSISTMKLNKRRNDVYMINDDMQEQGWFQ